METKNVCELQVITLAKNLCSYVMRATCKSPKIYRFTYVGKLQTLALDVVEQLYLANDVFVGQDIRRPSAANVARRLSCQRTALARLKLLAYLALAAQEQGCLTAKQYEQIALQCVNCQNVLAGWMTSDRKRFESVK